MDLRDALINSGLKQTDDLEAVEHGEKTRSAQRLAKMAKWQPEGFRALESAATVGEFKPIALWLLKEQKVEIREVIRIAHRFGEGTDGLKSLLTQLYRLEKAFEIVRPEYRSRIIQRHLRSSNPETGVPQEWQKR